MCRVAAPNEGPRAVGPGDIEAVAEGILAYLRRRFPSTHTAFSSPPAPIKRGMEGAVHGFRLEGGGLAAEWLEPLVVKVLYDATNTSSLNNSALVQGFLHQRGFPVPRPLAVEGPEAELGRPFLIMERRPEAPAEALRQKPDLRYRHLGRWHARLHGINPAGWPLPAAGPLVDRLLGQTRQMVATIGVTDLAGATRWLEGLAGLVRTEERCPLHNDFAIDNAGVQADGSAFVMDWNATELGDPHCDVGHTLALFGLLEMLPPGRLLRGWARSVIARQRIDYLRGYRELRSADAVRLLYWEALHTVQLWAMSQMVALPGVVLEGMPYERIGRWAIGRLGGGLARRFGELAGQLRAA